MDQHIQYVSFVGSSFIGEPNENTYLNVNDKKNLFNDLYKKLYLPVYNFAKTFVSPQDAEDITSESFLKLWRSNLDYTIEQRVKTWLNVCTKNACIDLLTNKKTQEAKHKTFAYASITDEEGKYELEIQEALLVRLDSEIEKLPPQCKKVCKMAYLQNMTSKEIAAILGISENTVSNHRVKGLKLLRFALTTSAILLLVIIFTVSCFSVYHW